MAYRKRSRDELRALYKVFGQILDTMDWQDDNGQHVGTMTFICNNKVCDIVRRGLAKEAVRYVMHDYLLNMSKSGAVIQAMPIPPPS